MKIIPQTDTDFCSFKVDEDVVVVVDGVGIGIGVSSSALEVLSTNQTAVYVDVR